MGGLTLQKGSFRAKVQPVVKQFGPLLAQVVTQRPDTAVQDPTRS